MKLNLPTGRTGQFAALGLPVLTLAALWLGVATPLMEWHGDRDTALARRLARLVRLLVRCGVSGRRPVARVPPAMTAVAEKRIADVQEHCDGTVMLSGSGPTILAIAQSQEDALESRAALLEAGFEVVHVATGPVAGAHVVEYV